MKKIILPALVATFAFATMAMADNATPTSTTSTTAKAQTVAPADGTSVKTDRTTTCSKPMATSTCSMHCGM